MRAFQSETGSLVFGLFITAVLVSTFSGSAQAKTPLPTKAATAQAARAGLPVIVQGWKLDQRLRVLGDQTLFVSPLGVKAVNRKDGVTIMSPAPYVEVFTYSTKTQKFCKQKFDKSENPYARAVAMFSGIAHGQVPMNKVKDYSKGGLQWSEYQIPDSYKKARIAMWKRKEVTSSEPASGRITGFHLPMDLKAVNWISRLYCVPITGSVPFDVTIEDVDAELHSLVKTFSMTSVKLSLADFKCPAGLKAVSDPRSVVQDESASDAIEMMMSPERK